MSTRPYRIVPAKPTLRDAAALLHVEGVSLADSPYEPSQIISVLCREEQRTYLAWLGDELVGFCSCFRTPVDAELRLEVDLLGVVPDYRGRGLGRALIAKAVERARAEGVHRARAVVAARNAASQQAFAKAGFGVAHPVTMVVYEAAGRCPTRFLGQRLRWHVCEQGCDTIPGTPDVICANGGSRSVYRLVHTLVYSGMWIERLWAGTPRMRIVAARGLVEEAKRRGLDEVGYLAPREPDASRGAPSKEVIDMVRAGYRGLGEYLVLEARFA